MKLRVRGESLRFRLTKSEVLALRDQGWWQDGTTFGSSVGPRLIYRVETTQSNEPTVRMDSDVEGHVAVVVVLRSRDVRIWADDQTVGLYFETPWALKVAVEKDFQCLDPSREEDETDNFDNPHAGTSTHDSCRSE